MESENIIQFLEKCKKDLIDIRIKNYKENQPNLDKIKSKISMIIRRIYPNYVEMEKKLLPSHSLIGGTNDNDEKYYQSHYQQYVDDAIEAIDVIEIEHELFKFDDFIPIKEKTETELQVGSEKYGRFWRKKKST